MSLVGPRPELPEFVSLWPAHLRTIVLSVRPGITDPCALEFSAEEHLLGTQGNPELFYRDVLMPIKVSRYVDYIQRANMRTDVCVILQTVREVFLKKGLA
jgi:lipopolysaccharide/colanic/teichoic acid biosynthesis glycosyltransferase